MTSVRFLLHLGLPPLRALPRAASARTRRKRLLPVSAKRHQSQPSSPALASPPRNRFWTRGRTTTSPSRAFSKAWLPREISAISASSTKCSSVLSRWPRLLLSSCLRPNRHGMLTQRESTTRGAEQRRDWTTQLVWTYPSLPNTLLHNQQDADLKPDYSEKKPKFLLIMAWSFSLNIAAKAHRSILISAHFVRLLLEESEVSYVHGLLRMPSVFYLTASEDGSGDGSGLQKSMLLISCKRCRARKRWTRATIL